jgi:hypothetical protein
MSNYVNERNTYIEQLTIWQLAYFENCQCKLQAELSILHNLICDIDYIIADLVYNEDFFDPRQLDHLKQLSKVYQEQLVQVKRELARVKPPMWTAFTETLFSSSEEEDDN